MNRTELREKLNKIDCDNCNQYDLVNLFESVKLSNEDLNKLSEMVEDKDIHDFLYERCYIAEDEEEEEERHLSDFLDSGDFHTVLVDDARTFDIHQWEKDMAEEDEFDDTVEEEITNSDEHFIVSEEDVQKVLDKIASSNLFVANYYKNNAFMKGQGLTEDDVKAVVKKLEIGDYSHSMKSTKFSPGDVLTVFITDKDFSVNGKDLHGLVLYIKIDTDYGDPVAIVSVHNEYKSRRNLPNSNPYRQKVEKLLEEENTAKIEIRKEYSWYNVYINNTMILKHISKEDADDIIDVLEKNNHPYIYKETESSRWADERRKAKETVEESMSSAVERQTLGYKKTKGQIQCNGGEQAEEVEDLLKAKYDNVTTQKGKGGKVIIKFSKNESLGEGFSKDDIEWLKSHKGEKLNKGKYKVEYQEYFDNDNNPIGGMFTLYKRAGRYGYDRYAFKNEDELIAYIKRHFFDESLSEDTDPKSARRERMNKFHNVFDSFGECTSAEYDKAFELFYDASFIDVVDHASKLKREYDGQKVKYRFTVFSDDYKNSADIHYDPYQNYIGVVVDNNKVDEDTVKQGNQWVNKGKEGTHCKFKTKKEADAQRKAMFARGFKESVKESLEDVWNDASLSGDSVSYKGHEIYRTPYGYQVTFDNGEEIEFADDREAMEYIDSLNEDVNDSSTLPDDYVLLDSRARNHTDEDIDLYYDCIKEFCMIDEIFYDDMEVTFITNQRDADDWDEETFKTDYTYTPDEESALECANDYLVKKYPYKITVGDIKKSADDVYEEVKDHFYEQAQKEAEEELTLSDFQEQLKEDKAKETMKSVVAKWRSRRSNKE